MGQQDSKLETKEQDSPLEESYHDKLVLVARIAFDCTASTYT
jgi:hypothetical protein